MTKVRISIPAKSAMQSGVSGEKWVIEFLESAGTRSIDGTMGWTSSNDMSAEVKLEFPTSAAAIAFAEKNDWSYEVIEPKPRRLIKKSYADNFK